jgi:adenylate cyclase class 2
MATEYEAKFYPVNKDEVREKLKKSGATLVRPEFLQKRVTFNLPKGYAKRHTWVRIRDEGNKITMSYKELVGEKIEDQKELMLVIDNFDTAATFLTSLGCDQKSYQENKRELWSLEGADISIDEWPFLEPFIEIEGDSEEKVITVARKLGFDWNLAIFGATHIMTSMKYGIPEDVLNADIPRIVFDMPNPYLEWLRDHRK